MLEIAFLAEFYGSGNQTYARNAPPLRYAAVPRLLSACAPLQHPQSVIPTVSRSVWPGLVRERISMWSFAVLVTLLTPPPPPLSPPRNQPRRRGGKRQQPKNEDGGTSLGPGRSRVPSIPLHYAGLGERRRFARFKTSMLEPGEDSGGVSLGAWS